MFYLGTLLRTIAQESATQIALRNCSKEAREEYIEVFTWNKQKQKHVIEHQKVTANHRKQRSQVNDFSAFLVWEDARVWAY